MDSEKFLLAKKAYNNKQYDEAYTYFSEILSNDENNYMCYLYRGFCNAFKTTLTKPYQPNLISSFKDGYSKVTDEVYKSDKYKYDSLEILEEVNKYIVFCLKMYYKKFSDEYDKYKEDKKKTEDYNKSSGNQANKEYIEQSINKINERYAKAILDLKSGVNLTSITFSTILDFMFSNVINKGYDIYDLNSYVRIDAIIESLYNRFKSLKDDESLLRKIYVTFDFMHNKVKKFEEDSTNKYWEEHKDEKDKLIKSIEDDKKTIIRREEELKQLEEQNANMKFELEETASMLKKNETEKRLQLLLKQMSSLGTFDMKSKRMYNEEKQKLEAMIKGLENNIKMETEHAQKIYDMGKKDLEDKIAFVKGDIVNLKRNISVNQLKLEEKKW